MTPRLNVSVLGESRPVNRRTAYDRAGRAGRIDWVGLFEEDTPQRLIAGIRRFRSVKRATHKPEEIAAKRLGANGGEVMVLNFEDGCSTTVYSVKRSRPGEREVKPSRLSALQTRRALIWKARRTFCSTRIRVLTLLFFDLVAVMGERIS